MKFIRSSHSLSEEDFEVLFKTLERKYPHAYKQFVLSRSIIGNLDQSLSDYLKSFRLELSCNETNVLKENFRGTYSYKLFFDKVVAKRLERRSLDFSYYGIKSFNAAFEKGVKKGFQVINCLLTMEISATEISRITDSVLPAVQEWRNPPLDAVYPFVFLDFIHYKVRVHKKLFIKNSAATL